MTSGLNIAAGERQNDEVHINPMTALGMYSEGLLSQGSTCA